MVFSKSSDGHRTNLSHSVTQTRRLMLQSPSLIHQQGAANLPLGTRTLVYALPTTMFSSLTRHIKSARHPFRLIDVQRSESRRRIFSCTANACHTPRYTFAPRTHYSSSSCLWCQHVWYYHKRSDGSTVPLPLAWETITPIDTEAYAARLHAYTAPFRPGLALSSITLLRPSTMNHFWPMVLRLTHLLRSTCT